ncbi:hypothetical protein OH77DRAFT_1525475 [Trametes cingulata]|nr:hypothetical protein OH77DRAFT_1525475 [Trametes cingulata]
MLDDWKDTFRESGRLCTTVLIISVQALSALFRENGIRRSLSVVALAAVACFAARDHLWNHLIPSHDSAHLALMQLRLQGLENRLQRHLYLDGTAALDYASIGAGGRIVSELTSASRTPNQGTSWRILSMFNLGRPAVIPPPPELALMPEARLGVCWPMKGRTGSLGISLSRPVAVTSFTIDHIPMPMTLIPEVAPRSGELWGHLEDAAVLLQSNITDILTARGSDLDIVQDRNSPYLTSQFLRLGTFDFDVHGGYPFKTFDVHGDIKALGLTFGTVVLIIKDNWGNTDCTCLYRVRVHSCRICTAST